MHDISTWRTFVAVLVVVLIPACELLASSGEITGQVSPSGAGGAESDAGATADAGGASCALAGVIKLDLDGIVTRKSTTVGMPGVSSPGGDCGVADGPERVYQIIPQSAGFLTVRVAGIDPSFDSVLYLRKSLGCDTPDGGVVCNDKPGTSGEVTSLGVDKDEPVYVFIDGRKPTDEGEYRVTFDLARGGDCADPIHVELPPGATTTLLGRVPMKELSDMECATNPGVGAPDVVYAFSPPGVMKTITVDPDDGGFAPAVMDADSCPGASAACHSAAAGAPVTFTTTRDWVWIDGTGDTRYHLTVTTP